MPLCRMFAILVLPVVLALGCGRNIQRTTVESHAYLAPIAMSYTLKGDAWTPLTAKMRYSKAFWTYMAQHYQQTMRLIFSTGLKENTATTKPGSYLFNYHSVGVHEKIVTLLNATIDAGESKQFDWDEFYTLPYPQKPYKVPLQPLTDEIRDDYSHFRSEILLNEKDDKKFEYSLVFDTTFVHEYMGKIMPYKPVEKT